MGKMEAYRKSVIEFEIHQRTINAIRMPLCMGKLRKVAHADSNWEIYYDRKLRCFKSIAKPGSGAEDSYYGNVRHMQKAIRNGWVNEKLLTKFGRRLMARG